MALYYNIDGEPIDLMEYARLFDIYEYQTVAKSHVDVDGQEVFVSTVWLGINHNWHPGGRPVIFETMIFGGPHNDDQWRYCTHAEAEAGHEHAVAVARGEIDCGMEHDSVDA